VGLEIHPDAAVNFENRANSLLLEIAPATPPPRTESSFRPERFIAAHITAADIIGEIRMGLVDSTGAEVAKHFVHQGRMIGFEGESFRKLRELSESMQRTKGVREKVSTTLVASLVFDWTRERYQSTTALPMVEYVLSKAAERIEDQELWIPISMLHIQSDFRVGRITLRTIGSALFDRWLEEANRQVTPHDSEKIQELVRRERKKLQGLAAATIVINAEPERAREIAFEEAEDALALLRFFSPANHHPEHVAYCTVLGKENCETYTHLTIRNERLVETASGMVDKGRSEWIITDSDLMLFQRAGLEALSRLQVSENRSSYQERLLDALQLYSKSCLSKDLADRLIYILIPLESIFLKDENEPIQQNIAERMAFFMRNRASERREIIAILRKVYSLRSSFLHHGKSLEDVETLRVFMRIAWECFCYLIQNVDRFRTVEQLLSAIEEARLS
jgi:hypothetical protein